MEKNQGTYDEAELVLQYILDHMVMDWMCQLKRQGYWN